MKEWAKLSGWTDGAGKPAYGLDEHGQLMGFDPHVRPARTDNFVYENFAEDLSPDKVKDFLADIQDPELRAEFETSIKAKRSLRGAIKEVFNVDALGYSQTNPLEDWAESYRAFSLDTELLVRKAPDKFLFLNSVSKKYTADQVKDLFTRSGKDPQAVATSMAESGLTQDSIERIFKANGLSANVETLGQDAAKALKQADLPPFRQAFMTIQARVADKDLAFVNAFTQNPASALGEVWNKLSPVEQAQFSDAAKRTEIVQKMQRGQMSGVSAASQGYRDIEVKAIRDLGFKLLDDQGFRAALQKDPKQALAALPGLPADLTRAMADPKFQQNFRQFASALDTMLAHDTLIGGDDLRKLMEQNLNAASPDSIGAALALVNEDPTKMAKVFLNLDQLASGMGGG
jgi:hypothetical protein